MSAPPPLPAADVAESGASIASLSRHFVGARFLVTGASGFVGRWLVAALCASGCPAEVVALGREPARMRAVLPKDGHALQIRQGDLLHPETLADLPPCTHVVHASAGTRRDGDPGHELADLDDADLATRNLLAACSRMPLRRVLLVSSGAAAEPPAPDRPGAGYALGKRTAELRTLLAARERGFAAVIARLWAHIGPGLPAGRGYAAADFIAAAGTQLRIHGDGTAVRSYQYPSDTATWLWTLLAEGGAGQIYDVGATEPVSIRELAGRIDRAAGGPGVVVEGAGPAGARYLPDVAAAAALGLRNRIGLDEAIARSLAWQRTTVLS